MVIIGLPPAAFERLPMSFSQAWSTKLPTGTVKSLALGALVAAIVGFLIYNDVENRNYSIYHNVADVPVMPAAIVFGAGIETREAHDRVATAAALYKAGKVKKLLMTGDNGHLNHNEPEYMKRDAISLGIPAQDITCDYAGFRTYDSLYRACNIFEVHKAVLVTQRYHLPRAMYLAQKLGLDTVGMDAGVRSYGSRQIWYDLREIGAAEAAWLDILTERKSKYLGKKEPLFSQTIEQK
jgi:SanA protein